jgi:hypothetical protein
MAKQLGAPVVVAKLDRLSRDVAFISGLEGIIRLVPPFEETVVIDTVRLHKINGRADWKWRAVGLIPPRWGRGPSGRKEA